MEDEREGGSETAHANLTRTGAARRRARRSAGATRLEDCRCAGDATEEGALAAVRVRSLRGGLAGSSPHTDWGLLTWSPRTTSRAAPSNSTTAVVGAISAKECADRKRGRLYGARRGRGIAVQCPFGPEKRLSLVFSSILILKTPIPPATESQKRTLSILQCQTVVAVGPARCSTSPEAAHRLEMAGSVRLARKNMCYYLIGLATRP